MYIKLNKNSYGYTDLEIEIFYDKGGMNYWTYEEEPRGYYLRVTPITRSRGWSTVTAFSGVKYLIETCKRLSRKRLDELTENERDMSARAVDYILNKYDLSIAE